MNENKLNNTILELLKGERIRISLDDLILLEDHVMNNVSDDLYKIFKKLASKDVTIGTIQTYEVFLNDWQPA